MSLTLLLLSVLILILFCTVFKKLYRNVQLYQYVSKQKDFYPNPSWTIGVLRVLLDASYRGYVGFSSFKLVTSHGREEPYSSRGALWTWVGSPFIGCPVLVPTRTEILRAILGTKQRVDKGYVYSILQEVFGHGLITGDKEIWNKHRKILNPTFHQQLLHNFVPIMSRESRNLILEIQDRSLEENGYLVDNITTLISHRVMAMLLGTAMGFEDEKLDAKFLELMERFDLNQFRRFQNPMKLFKWYYNKTEEGKEYYYVIDYVRGRNEKLIRKRMAQMKIDENKNISDRKLSFLDKLIEEHVNDPKSMTFQMIEDEFLTFLAAGWDTTTWTATFTLQMIGQHPKVQDKLVAEIDSVIGDISDDEELSMDALSKLKYLECVINETLRRYPLVNYFSRQLYEDLCVDIDDETRMIPAGTEILFDPDLIHRSPRYWLEPNKFDPDRFLTTSGRDPLSFIPFSYGPRNCIGKQFAMIEEKIMLSHILRRFRVKNVIPMEQVKFNMAGLARRTDEPIQLLMIPR